MERQVEVSFELEGMRQFSDALSTLREAIGGTARSCAAAGAALSELGESGGFVRAAFEASAEEEQRRMTSLGFAFPEPARRVPNGGIYLDLFGGVELPGIVHSVSVEHGYLRWAVRITLRGHDGLANGFLWDVERIYRWETGGGAERHHERALFLEALWRAVDALSGAGNYRLEIEDSQGRRVEFGEVRSASFRVDRAAPVSASTVGYVLPEVDGTVYAGGDSVTRCSVPRGYVDEAMERSKKLLMACLSPQQRDEFEQYGWFNVVATSGCAYQIHRRKSFGVHAIDASGTVTEKLCAGPEDDPPVYDYMLAAKMHLESDEAGFLKAANSFWDAHARFVRLCSRRLE